MPSPAAVAADMAGIRPAAGLSRQKAVTSENARAATMVMCNPEMLIRWLTPVRANSTHWSRGIAC